MTDDDDGDAIALVTTAGELDGVVVAVRDFLHRSGAVRVVAAVGDAVVDGSRFEPIEIERADGIVAIAHATPLAPAPPTLPAFDQQAPFVVDAETGEVRGALGGLQSLGDAVGALAAALDPGAVVVASFETTTDDVLLSLSARDGEPLVVMIGDEAFELDES